MIVGKGKKKPLNIWIVIIEMYRGSGIWWHLGRKKREISSVRTWTGSPSTQELIVTWEVFIFVLAWTHGP